MSKVEKPEYWRQDTARQQAATLVGCIRGWVSNLQDGTTSPERFVAQVIPHLDDLETLSNWLPNNWEIPHK